MMPHVPSKSAAAANLTHAMTMFETGTISASLPSHLSNSHTNAHLNFQSNAPIGYSSTSLASSRLILPQHLDIAPNHSQSHPLQRQLQELIDGRDKFGIISKQEEGDNSAHGFGTGCQDIGSSLQPPFDLSTIALTEGKGMEPMIAPWRNWILTNPISFSDDAGCGRSDPFKTLNHTESVSNLTSARNDAYKSPYSLPYEIAWASTVQSSGAVPSGQENSQSNTSTQAMSMMNAAPDPNSLDRNSTSNQTSGHTMANSAAFLSRNEGWRQKEFPRETPAPDVTDANAAETKVAPPPVPIKRGRGRPRRNPLPIPPMQAVDPSMKMEPSRCTMRRTDGIDRCESAGGEGLKTGTPTEVGDGNGEDGTSGHDSFDSERIGGKVVAAGYGDSASTLRTKGKMKVKGRGRGRPRLHPLSTSHSRPIPSTSPRKNEEDSFAERSYSKSLTFPGRSTDPQPLVQTPGLPQIPPISSSPAWPPFFTNPMESTGPSSDALISSGRDKISSMQFSGFQKNLDELEIDIMSKATLTPRGEFYLFPALVILFWATSSWDCLPFRNCAT